MNMRFTKALLSSLLAAAMLAPAAANLAIPLTASAGEILGETEFDEKILPWHLLENSPARQNFWIDDGALHITILRPEGAYGERSDLALCCRNLNFKKGHTYHVSFKVKAKRDGMELFSAIQSPTYDYYFVLDGRNKEMVTGPAFDGKWHTAAILTTEYQTFEGDFIPHEDLEGVGWFFEYADGSRTAYGGNAQAGDELWFDDMHIVDKTADEICTPLFSYYTNRDADGQPMFISVNQLGYYPGLAKIATLSDNQGDFTPRASKITIADNVSYTWELVDAKTEKVVKTGKTGNLTHDPDSGDRIVKIDFSDYDQPGTYYLRIQNQEWRSYPFRIGNDIYAEKGNDLLTNALNYYYQERSGKDIEAKYITSPKDSVAEWGLLSHAGGHKTDKAYVQKGWKFEYEDKDEAKEKYASSVIEATGGWYDASNYSKNLVSGGISVWTLQNLYERAIQTEDGKKKFEDGSGTCVVPESGNKVPDILDECRYELDFMQKMKVQADEPTWGDYAGLYYHAVQDHKLIGLATKPWDYEYPMEEGGWGTVRIVRPPTFAATLNYAACAAQAARLWKPYDADYAAELLQSAKDAYQAFKKHYYEADMKTTINKIWGYECPAEANNEVSGYAPVDVSPQYNLFGDYEVRDDAYWAACELYLSAAEMEDKAAADYLKELSAYKDAFKVAAKIFGGDNDDRQGSNSAFNWGNTASAGTLSLALHPELTGDNKSTIVQSICAAADTFLEIAKKQGYGIPYRYDIDSYYDPNSRDATIDMHYGFEMGSNGYAMNNMIAMAYAYDLTDDIKYIDGVAGGMDYMLGNNPLTFSYITGYGTYRAGNLTDKYFVQNPDSMRPSSPAGMLSSGPSPRIYDQYLRLLGLVPGVKSQISERCYADSPEAWSVNMSGLQYNAPLAWIAAFMQDSAAKVTGTHPVNGTEPPKTTESTAQTSETTSKATSETTTSTTADSQPAATADLGNVNGDKTVDVSDAVLLARFVAEDSEANLTAEGKRNADVNKNGSPDSDDVILILKYIAKLIDKF